MANGELDKKIERLRKFLKGNKATYEDIQEWFGVDYQYARKLMELLRKRGVDVEFDIVEGRRQFYIPDVPIERDGIVEYHIEPDSDGYVTFGIISDTHLGSKFERLDALYDFYERAKAEGVSLIIHAGDLIDGNGKQYKGHIYEMKGEAIGADNIIDYVIRNYPKMDGVLTAVVASGNHDLSYYKTEGLDVVKHIARQREDIDYIGQYAAKVKIDGVTLYAVHPDGGTPYALSYRSQRMLERMVDKPDILVRGHLHISLYMNYLGTHVIEAGCFQDQTKYMERKGLTPQVGGWIIKMKLDENGKIEEFLPKWIGYK